MDFNQIVAKYQGEGYQAHLGLLFHTSLYKIDTAAADLRSRSQTLIFFHL